MGKKLSDYLHFFIGCKMLYSSHHEPQNEPYTLTHDNVGQAIEFGDRPILRRLEDITPGELKEMIIKLSKIDLSDCEFEYDFVGHTWVNAIRKGVVVDCLVIENNGNINMDDYSPSQLPQAEAFHYLLKQGFDLFGLIDAGLAVDEKTCNK
jgi:hypothetical protein